MKVCKLSFAVLFSLYFYGAHGRSSYYQTEIQPHRSEVKASSVNEEEELHVNDPEVVSLSTLVVDQLNHEKLENDDPLFLLEIVKAATQEVSGSLKLLTLKVSQGGVKEMCEIKILDQPWSHKMELVHSKCGSIPAKYEPHAAITNDEHRHDSHDGISTVEELDVSNAEVFRLSTIAVDELNKEIVEGSDRNNLLEIVKAFVQAESGKMTNLIVTLKVSQGHVIKTCEVIIQQQIWLNETKVTESKCENETNETVIEESKEFYGSNDDYQTEAFVNNGFPIKTSALAEKEREAINDDDDVVKLNVNDKEVVSLGAVSLIELNAEKQEDDPPLILSKIVKAMLHKHSGKVTLTLKVSQGDTEDTCKINISEDFAVDKLDITHSKCGTIPVKNKPENTNTREGEMNVNDPEVVRLSVIAMVELNEHNHAGDDPINLLEIVKVSRHIDSGNSTSMTLKVSQGREKKMCDVKILEKYRPNISQVIESKCEIIKHDEMHPVNHQVNHDSGVHDTVVHVSDKTHDHYTKDSDSFTLKDVEREEVDSLGVEEELDVNDPEVIHLSTLAMVTLNNEKLKEDDTLILLEIIKAANHLSSGNSTSLTLKISQGGVKYVCEMEFLPQPDRKKSEVKHSKCGTVPAKFKTEGDGIAHGIGGVEKLEVNDPKVIRLSMIAMVELYEKYPTKDPINLLEIVKASRQVVSGMLTSLTLKVSQGDYEKMCDIQILEQPWLKITKITHAECDDINEKDDKLLEIHGVNGLSRIIPLSKSVSSW